jgi:hypothetical protein
MPGLAWGCNLPNLCLPSHCALAVKAFYKLQCSASESLLVLIGSESNALYKREQCTIVESCINCRVGLTCWPSFVIVGGSLISQSTK